jgi:ABC-type nitrate/sulfonate/bicarbonate transport system substrate-binding protein
MMGGHMPQKAKFSDAARKLLSILLLMAVLTGVLIVSGAMGAQPGNQALLVSLPAGPQAYCAFPLVEDKDGRYSVSLESGYGAVLAALQAGTPDAALIPAQYLSSVDTKMYTAAAVTSYLNLVAVQNGGTAATIFDLNGRFVVMPSSLEGTSEYKMLRFLLNKTNAAPNIALESDEAIAKRAQTGDFEFMILPADESAAVLLENQGYRSCFNLASQWTSLLGETPPAGEALVIRNESITNHKAAAAALLADIKTGIDYANAKHQKAAQYIAVLGLGADAARILKTLPHCAFSYLEGNEMNASLQALEQLTQGS